MAVVVYTQVLENGEDVPTDSWKYWTPKSPDRYVVFGTDDRPANALALVTWQLSKLNVSNGCNSASQEYIKDWALVSNKAVGNPPVDRVLYVGAPVEFLLDKAYGQSTDFYRSPA